jgi:hypothetical protein
MGLNALSEVGVRDEKVTTIIRSAAASQRTALRELLHKAVIAGELPADRVDSAADFVDATLAGIRYAAKTGNSRKALRELACLLRRRSSVQCNCCSQSSRLSATSDPGPCRITDLHFRKKLQSRTRPALRNHT